MLAKILAKVVSEMNGTSVHHGKQSVKQLVRQGAGISSIPVKDSEVRGFERIAKKYGVDFAIKKDSSSQPPKFLVFFKARDAEALTAAFSEFTTKTLNRENKKPSILSTLNKMKEIVKSQVTDRVRNKDKGREI